jgi:hypothetical protein
MDSTVSVWKISGNVPQTPGGLEIAIMQSASTFEERVQHIAQSYRQTVKKRSNFEGCDTYEDSLFAPLWSLIDNLPF